MQKIGYAFPGQRSICYSAALVLRQYQRVKEDMSARKETFSYRHIKDVYNSEALQEMDKNTARFSITPEDGTSEGVQSVMGGKVIETEAKRILNAGKQEERVNTERERRRADAAEQRADILQEELEKVKQQLRDALLLQGNSKAMQQ